MITYFKKFTSLGYKKIMLCCLVSIFSLPANSQVLIALLFGDKLNSDKLEFGLTTGLNTSYLGNSNAKGKNGLALGLYFNIKLAENLYFHPEALPKSPFGARGIEPYSLGDENLDIAFANGQIKRKLKYISLPLLMRYRLTGLFFAEAGPQIGLMTKPVDEFKADVADGELQFTRKIKTDLTKFDFGMAGGVVMKLKKEKGMGLGIRYYYGLTDVMKNAAGHQRNTALLLYLSVPVGGNKPK